MNKKQKFLDIYKHAYLLECYAIKQDIYTESELYDIRYEINKKLYEEKKEK